MTTVDDSLTWARIQLLASGSPSLDAHLLLGYVLAKERAWLLAHGEEELLSEHLEEFQRLVDRRATGEPVAYLLGRALWYDLELEVTSAVLVPRPETELLVEVALHLVAERGSSTIADIGTGSGAIAIALARALPNARVYATETSVAALAVAKRNLTRYALQNRVALLQGELLAPLPGQQDLIVSNLPYLSTDQLRELPPDVRYEPLSALSGGHHGHELYEALIDQLAATTWTPMLALEIDPSQSTYLRERLERSLTPGQSKIWVDLAGRERVLTYCPLRPPVH